MKFSLASIAALVGMSAKVSALDGSCVKGSGEFTYLQQVDAHFTLDACLDESASNRATGVLQSGQFNKDGDVFNYRVHCMHHDADTNDVYVGAEVQQLSEYVKTYQDPEAFRQSLVDGDKEYILAYERRVHGEMVKDAENGDKYLEALSNYLMDSQGMTIEEYEHAIGYEAEPEEGTDDLKNRKLKKGKGGKGGKSGKGFFKFAKGDSDIEDAPLLVSECASSLIYNFDICNVVFEGENPFDAVIDAVGSTPPTTWDFGFEGETVPTLQVPVDEFLTEVCAFTLIPICGYTSLLTFPWSNFRDRNLLIESGTEEENVTPGTMALFKLNLDPEDHSISVKLGHDQFDTMSCKDFVDKIDHEFFNDETVDKLTKGEIVLN